MCSCTSTNAAAVVLHIHYVMVLCLCVAMLCVLVYAHCYMTYEVYVLCGDVEGECVRVLVYYYKTSADSRSVCTSCICCVATPAQYIVGTNLSLIHI